MLSRGENQASRAPSWLVLGLVAIGLGCDTLPEKADDSDPTGIPFPTGGAGGMAGHAHHGGGQRTEPAIIDEVTVATSTEVATCTYIAQADVTEAIISDCCEPSDCTIVPYSHCCGLSRRAININYVDAYNAEESWQSYYGELCATYGMCPDDSEITTVTCKEQRCVLVY